MNNIVINQIENAYKEIAAPGIPWDKSECMEIFEYFYTQYEKTFGRPHPNIKTESIKKLIQAMPFITDPDTGKIDLEPQDYFRMIDDYFKQTFENCNYSIAHFMSGNIRLYRYYGANDTSNSAIDDFITQVVEYLNERTGKAFKTTVKETRQLITERQQEGFTIDDFKAVIDNKATEWSHEVKMHPYLRPKTLFGDKFETYLNEKADIKPPWHGFIE